LQDGKAITTEGSANGQVLTWSEDDSQATFETPTVSPVTMGGDVTGSSDNATVVKIQNIPVSTTDPTVGKVLQFDGTQYTPADIPQGGSGGGGVTYFFNKGTPVTGGNLPSGTYQLGRTAEAGQTDVPLTNLAVGSWTRVGGFVTDASDPSLTSIPAGLWDFNIWAESTAAANNQAFIRVRLYAYDGSTNPEAGTLLAETDYIYLYDANVPAQYIASMLIAGGTTLASTSTRLYLLIEAQASTSNRDLTIYFGNSTPSHTHTTVPSVAGTGLVHVVDGVVQSPATAVGLGSSDVTGTLPVGNGGTGATSLTGYVKGTGTSAFTASAAIPVADVTGAAPLNSPAFTGTPSLPTGTTGVTQSAGNNTTALATTAFVTTAVAAAAGSPYDVAGEYVGKPPVSTVLMRFVANRSWTLKSSLVRASCTAFPTGSNAVATISIAGSNLSSGTITWTTSSTVTVGSFADTTITAGQAVVLTVTTADSNNVFENPFFTLGGVVA
jgi:hypothetical protein